MKKKPEKQKKEVVVDEKEIEYIGGRPVEYVDPEEATAKIKDAVPSKSEGR